MKSLTKSNTVKCYQFLPTILLLWFLISLFVKLFPSISSPPSTIDQYLCYHRLPPFKSLSLFYLSRFLGFVSRPYSLVLFYQLP